MTDQVRMYTEMVEQDGLYLKRVPKNFLTPAICKAAVEKNEMALDYVPSDLLTEPLCRYAMDKYGLYIESVPEHVKTVIFSNAQDVIKDREVMEHYEKVFFIAHICNKVVQSRNDFFQFVPDVLKPFVKVGEQNV